MKVLVVPATESSKAWSETNLDQSLIGARSHQRPPDRLPFINWIRYLLDVKACAELRHLCRCTTTTPENPFRTRRGLTHRCAAVRLWQLLISFHSWAPARRLGGWQMVASKGDLRCTPSVRDSSFKDVAGLGLGGHGSFWPGQLGPTARSRAAIGARLARRRGLSLPEGG
jgi:hypothetical protein